MIKNPLVSVIILNYNGINYIENCLKSVLDTDYDNFEVILVDNASTDGSFELIKRKFASDPRVKIIRNPTNMGFSGGNNVGFRYARGKYVVLLNNDTIVERNWIKDIIAILENHPEIAIIQPMVVNLEDRNKVQNIGFFVDKILLLSKPIASMKSIDKIKQLFLIRGITYATGACLFIRREALRVLGYFDPKFKIYFDDTYWGLLAWLAGYSVASTTIAKIYHKGSATIDVIGVKFKHFYGTTSRIAVILRLYPTKMILISFLSFLLLWFAYSVYKAIKLNIPAMIMSTIKAYYWSLSNLSYIVGWRKLLKMRVKFFDTKRLFKHMLPNPLVFKKVASKILNQIINR